MDSTSATETEPSTVTQQIRKIFHAARCYILQWTLSMATLLMLSLASQAASQGGAVSSPGPIWRLDVRKLGYTPPQRTRDEGVDVPLYIESIHFLTATKAVVTFVTREAPATLPRHGQVDETLPFRLHALFIDTVEGSVFAKLEWPTSSVRSRVLAIPGGNFLVFTPVELLLYSSEMNYLRKLELTLNRKAAKDGWYTHVSPGGKYLLFGYMPAAEERRRVGMPLDQLRKQETDTSFEWIDLENLQSIQNWSAKNWPYDGSSIEISDEGMALDWTFVKGENRGVSSIATIGRLPNGPWRLIDSPLDSHNSLLGRFVNNETILNMRYIGGQDKNVQVWMGLVNTSGGLLFQETFLKGEVPFRGALLWGEAPQRGVVISAGGQRFVLALAKIKGANTTLDIGGHLSLDRIVVYDIPSRQRVYTLDAKTQKIKSISGMALSPDGSLLGLINQDGVLEAYRVSENPNPRAIR